MESRWAAAAAAVGDWTDDGNRLRLILNVHLYGAYRCDSSQKQMSCLKDFDWREGTIQWPINLLSLFYCQDYLSFPTPVSISLYLSLSPFLSLSLSLSLCISLSLCLSLRGTWTCAAGLRIGFKEGFCVAYVEIRRSTATNKKKDETMQRTRRKRMS